MIFDSITKTTNKLGYYLQVLTDLKTSLIYDYDIVECEVEEVTGDVEYNRTQTVTATFLIGRSPVNSNFSLRYPEHFRQLWTHRHDVKYSFFATREEAVAAGEEKLKRSANHLKYIAEMMSRREYSGPHTHDRDIGQAA